MVNPMSESEQRELEQRFAAEWKEKIIGNPDPVVLVMDREEAWAVFSQLQLALRHPMNGGPTADNAMTVARRIQGRVAEDGALAQVAEMGWQSEYDVERTDVTCYLCRKAIAPDENRVHWGGLGHKVSLSGPRILYQPHTFSPDTCHSCAEGNVGMQLHPRGTEGCGPFQRKQEAQKK